MDKLTFNDLTPGAIYADRSRVDVLVFKRLHIALAEFVAASYDDIAGDYIATDNQRLLTPSEVASLVKI